MNLLVPLVLIVDIENLKPPIGLERAISNAFGGVSVMKIAVGNWKLLSCDRELKARGYHLFHTPQGQDAADIEICDLANLLGNGTKIVIVSNDKIFIDLAVRLDDIEDKSIYIVRKHRHKYYLSEWMCLLEEQVILTPPVDIESQSREFSNDLKVTPDQQTDIPLLSTSSSNDLIASSQAFGAASPTLTVKFASGRELANILKNLVKEHQITSPENLGNKFKAVYGIGVKEAIKSLKLKQKLTVFLSSRGIMSGGTSVVALSATFKEAELIDELKKLIAQNPSFKGDIGKICHRWKEQHQVSLHISMKQVGIVGKPGALITKIKSDPN